MVKNVYGVLGFGTLKSRYLKNELMKWPNFSHAETNLGKLKGT